MKIVFFGGAFCYKYIKYNEDPFPMDFYVTDGMVNYDNFSITVELIGNIHENKELLNENI